MSPLRRKRVTAIALAAMLSLSLVLTRGCTVAEVNPRHTSQRCSRCGHTARANRRSRALFQCRACGYTLHADLNGTRNIAAAYQAGPSLAGTGGLSVNQPDVAHRELVGVVASCRL